LSYASLAGTGSYLPEKVLSNTEGETTCDLAEKAARNAIDAAGINANEIDLIIVATTTADCVFPSVACLLQHRLGVTNATPAFDVQAVCAGCCQFFCQSRHRLQSAGGGCRNFLTHTQLPGIHSTHLHADGRYTELLHVPEGISRGYTEMQQQGAYVQMRGSEVFRTAVARLSEVVDETLKANDLQKSDIDWLVPHQANLRIIKATARKLAMTLDNVVVTVQDHGNTSAASIPLALDAAVRDGRIKRGEKLLLEGFGGGFTWGSALITY